MSVLQANSLPTPPEDLYRRLFDEVSEAILAIDGSGRIALCNRSVARLFGWEPEELIGKSLDILIPARFHHAHGAHLARFRSEGVKSAYMGKPNDRIVGLHREGHEIHLGTTIMRMKGPAGDDLMVAVIRDISERILYLNEIQRLADRDMLTGLYNRRSFCNRLEGEMPGEAGPGSGYWLALFDLDGFKAINDIYGHRTGDLLLQDVARRIEDEDSVHFLSARMGGDEFAIALPGEMTREDVEKAGNRIIESISRPYEVLGNTLAVGVSAGFAQLPQSADTLTGLLERADFALYHSKEVNRGGLSVFVPSCEPMLRQKSRIEFCLRNADLAREFFLDFQPIVDLRSNRISHFEALARWASPELGRISPSQFIPAAERCGRIHELTRTLFSKALREAASWPRTTSLSFNLSPLDVVSPANIGKILDLLEKSPVAPRRVEFELTESSIITDFGKAAETLSAIAARGASISLDDFGSGYSSYAYIDRLPINKLKIDKSFIRRLSTTKSASHVVKGIAELAANLNLSCVAEGVETEFELDLVRNANIRYAQGYFFSPPLHGREVPEILLAQAEA